MCSLFEEASDAVEVAANKPTDKHVHVLLKTNHLCRALGGIMGVFCKSGKDRTAMGVTLDMTHSLIEDSDVQVSQGMNICQLLRQYGVRRMTVYANTGQSLYAFGQLDRMTLPACFNPPTSICSGAVNT